MEQMIKDIKEKVDNLEYKEIKPLKEEIHEVKTSLAINSTLIQQCTKTNEQLNQTMSSVRDTMLEMNMVMQNANKEVSGLGNTINEMKQEFDKDIKSINDRVTGIDNKTKIDTSSTTRDIFKNALVWLFGGGAFVAILTYVLTNSV